MSRRELARFAEVDYHDLCDYERGDASPTFATLLALANTLGVSIYTLLTRFENQEYVFRSERRAR